MPLCLLSGFFSTLFPSSVQVLPIVVPPASATLVLCRWEHQCMADRLCHSIALHEHKKRACRSEELRTGGGKP
jgi:hypothetical protein